VAGATGGFVAGMVLSVMLMAVAAFVLHMGVWAAPKMAYSLLAGPEAIRPGFERVPVLVGMGVHFTLAIAYGLFFAWLATVLPMELSALGALFGIALYLQNLVIQPSITPHWVGHMFPPNATLHALAIVEHVVFGLVLASTYRAFRRMPDV
jgi:hypothetical protein